MRYALQSSRLPRWQLDVGNDHDLPGGHASSRQITIIDDAPQSVALLLTGY
jgi:hypothetical protein